MDCSLEKSRLLFGELENLDAPVSPGIEGHKGLPRLDSVPDAVAGFAVAEVDTAQPHRACGIPSNHFKLFLRDGELSIRDSLTTGGSGRVGGGGRHTSVGG